MSSHTSGDAVCKMVCKKATLCGLCVELGGDGMGDGSIPRSGGDAGSVMSSLICISTRCAPGTPRVCGRTTCARF